MDLVVHNCFGQNHNMVHEKPQELVKAVVDLPGGYSGDLDYITRNQNELVVGLL